MAKIDVPALTFPVRRATEFVELSEHGAVVRAGGDVDREHAGRVAHPEQLLSRQLPVHVARKRVEVRDPPDVVLAIEDGLVQVRD